MIKILFYEMIV